MLEQLYGWIANVGFLVGAILLAKKNIWGFHAQILANILYLIQSIIMKNYALLWLSIILVFINLYGIIKWSK